MKKKFIFVFESINFTFQLVKRDFKGVQNRMGIQSFIVDLKFIILFNNFTEHVVG